MKKNHLGQSLRWIVAIASLLSAIVCSASQPLRIDALTLEEKIGQLFMISDALIDAPTARQLGIGSILIAPANGNRIGVVTPAQWRAYIATYGPAWKTSNAASNAPPPILFGMDAVHGQALVAGATVFPHNIGLAATRDPDLMEQIGAAVASEVAATGVNWILAPAIGSTPDPRWGRTYEGWGASYDQRAGLAGAFIRGVQSATEQPVLTCAKHFLADGQAVWGTGKNGGIDQGDIQLDEATLRRNHLPPYREAIAAGVPAIMVSYGSWKGRELHHHPYLLQQVLRGELGFQGVVVSDFNGFVEAGEDPGERAISALRSGVDLLMVGKNWREAYASVLAAARDGSLPARRIDEAVGRILAMKDKLSIEAPAASFNKLDNTFGGATHHALARRAVAESATLLQDRDHLLPLTTNTTVLVLGPKADHAGVQCGGWTLQWGGLKEPQNPRLKATTLLDALTERTPQTILYHQDGPVPPALIEQADICIVAIGEPSTAEWVGDNEKPALSSEDQQLLQQAETLGLPVIAVIFSGRPVEIGPSTETISTWLAAWLPGAAGEGLADVLFGDQQPNRTPPIPWDF